MKTRRVTKNGISWTEVVPWAPPPIDQPIRPLTQAGPPEVALGLYGDDQARRATERRRKVNALLEKHGLRQGTW